MELRHLSYLLAIVKEGNFIRAAKRIRIFQSALSTQIQNLEEELGTVLFTRTNRRTELTEAGVLFRIEAERVLAQADQAKNVVAQAARGEIGQLRIGFSGVAAVSGRLAGNVSTFMKSHSKVHLSIDEIAPPYQAAKILAGELDIGYAPSFGALFERELTSDLLESWPWLVVMHAGHELAASQAVTSSGLAGQRIILYAVSGVYLGQLITLQRLLGREPPVAHRTTNMLSLLAMVAAGQGLALIPAPLAMVHMPNLAFRPLEGFHEGTSLLLLSGKGDVPATARQFRMTALEDSVRQE